MGQPVCIYIYDVCINMFMYESEGLNKHIYTYIIYILICPVSACKLFLTAQCDLVVPMYPKKEPQIFLKKI